MRQPGADRQLGEPCKSSSRESPGVPCRREEARAAQPRTDSSWGMGTGSGSTLYATRAGHFFPSPRGGDMCFSISNMSL